MTNQNQEFPSSSEWKQSIEIRQERVDYYFDTVLAGQRKWYSDKAGQQKTRHLCFAISVVVLGALISFLQVFGQPWISVLTSFLGATVAVLRSLDTLLRPNETWQAYRKASEGMKREHRLYITDADPYSQAEDEEAAYRLFVGRVETVIAEEQKLFWQFHAEKQAAVEAKEPEIKAK